MKNAWSTTSSASRVLEKFNRREHTGNRGTIGIVQ